MNSIRRIISDEDGYGSVEMLVLIAGAIVIASAIYAKLLTPIQEIHKKGVESIKGVSGTGF